MKKWLQEHLICPECRETANPLILKIVRETDQDVLEGKLVCENCGSDYAIHEGIAILVPKQTLPHVHGHSGYNSQAMLSAYLWSHYSEFFNGPDATDAYKIWASCFKEQREWAIDIGCSVGRLSFELSRTHQRVIGLDTSFSFVKKAQELLYEKQVRFDLIIEGQITEERKCDLDLGYQFDAVDFIVADAMALPFRTGLFDTAASVNILEKVPHPANHLREVNRVLNPDRASFLFSDPFSWDESVSDPGLWLSGLTKGEFQGRGMDNMCRIMEGAHGVFEPPFRLTQKGDVLWKIRKTQNLWEYITSQFIIGTRDTPNDSVNGK